MNQSADIGELAKALAAVHAELQPIVKDSTNPHFKNKYASLDTLMGDVRPRLAKQGLSVVQGGGAATGGVCVTTMLVHTSGQWIASEYLMPLEKATAQSAGSAITYGRRYGLSAILALATEEDDDGQQASASRNTRKAAPAVATDEQIQKIQELADATGDLASVKDKIKNLTPATADAWIERLTAKLKSQS